MPRSMALSKTHISSSFLPVHLNEELPVFGPDSSARIVSQPGCMKLDCSMVGLMGVNLPPSAACLTSSPEQEFSTRVAHAQGRESSE